jgi:hypothetical protein
MTDIFVPMMMNADSIRDTNMSWFRTFVRIKPSTALEPLRAKLQSLYLTMELERSKGWVNQPKALTDAIPKTKLSLVTAGEGISGMQTAYRSSLATLGVLVLLVLLIACVNVSNLMTALAAARGREMALRVSSERGGGGWCRWCWWKA